MKRHRNETDKERKKMANSIFIKADELAKELDSEERPAMTICAGSLYLIGALRSMIVKNKRN